MLARKFAAVAAAAGILLSASACSFNPHPDSLQSYAPSDGSGADIDLGAGHGIKLRNFVALTDGTDNALLGVLVNTSAEPETVSINYAPAGDAAQTESITIPANGSYSLGYNGNPASTLNLSGSAGQLVELSFGAGNNSTWAKLSVPILDGTFGYYKSIVDNIPGFNEPTPVPTPTATDVATTTN